MKKPYSPQVSWFSFVCLFIYLSSSPYIFSYIDSGLQQVRAPCWISCILLCFCSSEHLGLVLLPQGNTLLSLYLLSLSRNLFTWNLTIHKVHLLCENLTDTIKRYYIQVLRVHLPEKRWEKKEALLLPRGSIWKWICELFGSKQSFICYMYIRVN